MTIPDDFFYPGEPTQRLLETVALLPEGSINIELRAKELFVGKAIFDPTPGARKFAIVFEPTEFLLGLIATVGTGKIDQSVVK